MKYLKCFLFFFCFASNVEAQDSTFVVKKINISGNGTTADKIILRELPFELGDTLQTADTVILSETIEQNLINTSLFHFANVLFADSGVVDISLLERWYIWPAPFINIEERNFNVWMRNLSFEKVSYGIYVSHENFRGRRETLRLLFKTGYNQLYGISYNKPNIDKKQNWGIAFTCGYESSHSLNYSVLDHEPKFLKLEKKNAFSSIYASAVVSRRVGLYQTHRLSFSIDANKYADSLFNLSQIYVPAPKWRNLTLIYFYRYDFRDIKNYPLKGWYVDFELNSSGIPAVSSFSDKKIFVRNTTKKYFKITKNLYFASSACFHFALLEEKSFINATFMGYGATFVRGFEYNVIPVKHFILNKNNLKYNILPQKIIKLPIIKSPKFNKVPIAIFSNIFFDNSWSERGMLGLENSLSGKYLFGYGLGIDFVTYYDKVFRIEFSQNRFSQKGIFLHFTAPI